MPRMVEYNNTGKRSVDMRDMRHVGHGKCDYDDYTCRHPHQRVEEHKGSTAGQHLREQHNKKSDDTEQSV